VIKTKLTGANHYFIKTHPEELAGFIAESLHITKLPVADNE